MRIALSIVLTLHGIISVLGFVKAFSLAPLPQLALPMNFFSDDRPALAPDNKTFVAQRWSTPVGEYRAQAGVRLASRGEARYRAQSGEFAYIEFGDLQITYE